VTGERGKGKGEWEAAVRSGWHALGRLARAARHAPDRLLHPLRRRLARKRLARGPAPRSVLVVCHGNICRSPYAATLLRAMLADRGADPPAIASAGFLMLGRPVPAAALRVAARRGVDLSNHRSQLITAAALQVAELIVVMEAGQGRAVRAMGAASNVVVLGDLDPEPIEARTVRDPVGQGADVFEESYARIDRCVAELVAAIGARNSFDRPNDPGAPRRQP
jgi:protein-tyrosine phosphatase